MNRPEFRQSRATSKWSSILGASRKSNRQHQAVLAVPRSRPIADHNQGCQRCPACRYVPSPVRNVSRRRTRSARTLRSSRYPWADHVISPTVTNGVMAIGPCIRHLGFCLRQPRVTRRLVYAPLLLPRKSATPGWPLIRKR